MPENSLSTDHVRAPAKRKSHVPEVLAWVGGILGVIVLVLIMQGLGVVGKPDFPHVPPEEMADRAFQRSQEAYTVLGFTRTLRPGVEDLGVSTENTFSSGRCYGGGLLSGLKDEVVDGAYQMHHSWAVDQVPADRAVPALRRLRQHLEDSGWQVTSYRDDSQDGSVDLYVQRDDEDERMSFHWYADREYFTGGSNGPCAYDPEWRDGDVGLPRNDQRPPAFGPAHREE